MLTMPLTRELTLPLQQPLNGEPFEEETVEHTYQPLVRRELYEGGLIQPELPPDVAESDRR